VRVPFKDDGGDRRVVMIDPFREPTAPDIFFGE
jgi:hypothetical protein